jgi:hypothetical protein
MIKLFNPLEIMVRVKAIFRRIYEFDKNSDELKNPLIKWKYMVGVLV